MITTAVYVRGDLIGAAVDAFQGAPEVVCIADIKEIYSVPSLVASVVSRCQDTGQEPTPHDYACRWCLARGECGPYASYQAMRDVDWFADLTASDPAPDNLPALLPQQEVMPMPATLSSQQIAQVLERAPSFSAWLEAVQAELVARMLGGEQVDGWKVVAANTREKYTDEEAAIKWLTEHRVGKERFLNEPKLRTPAQVRKGMKDRGLGAALTDEFEQFVTRPDGAPTAVPSSDRRPPLVVLTAMFDSVESPPNT